MDTTAAPRFKVYSAPAAASSSSAFFPFPLTTTSSRSTNFCSLCMLVCAASSASSQHSNANAAASPSPLTPTSSATAHTISVFDGGESGIINRITGVFARRGSNIESLAVGLNNEKALFPIVVSGTQSVLRQVVEQLNKLADVIKVQGISPDPQVERELMLIKLNADPKAPPEIMGLVDIFRAKVVDICDHSLTIEVTGDTGKMVAVQGNLSKFGIREIPRTGKEEESVGTGLT